MRFCLLVTLFVISFQAEKVDAMNIQCRFYTADNGFGNKNDCLVLSFTLSSPEDREITSVNGDDAKTYNDVGWFQSYYKTFDKFPKNIKKFFPNVETVRIFNASITTLTKSDMVSLGPQLRQFSSDYNNIKVLEEGLFDENPNLEYINLNYNKIKFVASGIFDKLPKLTSLHFINNHCHSGSASNDRAAVLTLIEDIKGKCQDVQTITTTTTEKIKTEHELRIEELTAENVELKRQQLANDKKHQEELQNYKAEASLKDSQNKKLEMQIEALKKEVAAIKQCELHEVRDSIMSKLKELKKDLESKFEATHEKIDTTKDMIDTKLDLTLVKPMSSLHAKLDTMDLKLDTNDENFAFLNATCNGLDYKLNALECIRQP